jgi:hypothetical protein
MPLVIYNKFEFIQSLPRPPLSTAKYFVVFMILSQLMSSCNLTAFPLLYYQATLPSFPLRVTWCTTQ